MAPIIVAFTLFVLALIIGVAVIGRVPATLHTPLMSGANSIHGVVLIGVIIVAAHSDTLIGNIIVFFAALLGTLNVVGGYVVTDRMLEMFKPKTASTLKEEQIADGITVVTQPDSTNEAKTDDLALKKEPVLEEKVEEKVIVPSEETVKAADLANSMKELDDLLSSLKTDTKSTVVKPKTASKTTVKKPVTTAKTTTKTAAKTTAKTGTKQSTTKKETK